jgi:Zn-dependent metalloprotease
MVYGDGDGQMFKNGAFTQSLDVIAHELTHGVTQFTAGLRYRMQSGALNEHFSDVFGSLVKQRFLGQTADQADWLIGEGILGPQLPGTALRSLKAPGTAFQFDNQPAHMDRYAELPDDGDPRHDSGGVHINSGIPNHAFYLVAMAMGGNAWEKAGTIWYTTLTTRLDENSDFQAAADVTVDVSGKLFGAGGAEQQAVLAGRIIVTCGYLSFAGEVSAGWSGLPPRTRTGWLRPTAGSWRHWCDRRVCSMLRRLLVLKNPSLTGSPTR